MKHKDIPQEEWDAIFAVNMDGGACSDGCPSPDGPCPCFGANADDCVCKQAFEAFTQTIVRCDRYEIAQQWTKICYNDLPRIKK